MWYSVFNMERIPDTSPDEESEDDRRINDLMNKRGISYEFAREILGIAPEEVVPAQRKPEEADAQRAYNPPRDARGRELPPYFERHEPLEGDAARTQDEINEAGSAKVRAVLAALKKKKQDNDQ